MLWLLWFLWICVYKEMHSECCCGWGVLVEALSAVALGISELRQ